MKIPSVNLVLDAKPQTVFPRVKHLAPVDKVEQHGHYWCWAACLASILGVGENPRKAQAMIVSKEIPCLFVKCDQLKVPSECDETRQPDQVVALWRKELPKTQYSTGLYVKFADELKAKRPVHIVYERHAVLVDGWKQGRNGTTVVRFMDPQNGTREWRGVAVLKQHDSAGKCLRTIYGIK